MKRFIGFMAVLVLVLSLGTTAFAQDYEGGNWYVSWNGGSRLYDSRDSGEGNFADVLSELQPGDNATFTMELRNEYPSATAWYMRNAIIKSLEQTENQSAAKGGAYSYDLRYYAPDGTETILYTSSSIGGTGKTLQDLEESKVGLNEATLSLDDWLYLDTISGGRTGNIVLNVALEGETQGNVYQDTYAQLQMDFAVELNDITTTNWRPVRTGDEANILLWSGIMLGCGLAAVLLGVYTLRRNRKNREENGDE